MYILVKRNPLFLHEIEWKNNGFLFTTPNTIYIYNILYIYIYKLKDIVTLEAHSSHLDDKNMLHEHKL